MGNRRPSAVAILCLAITALSILGCSCASPYPDNADHRADPNPDGGREESLFSPRTDEGGEPFLEFETSDPAYLCPRGYTLWSLKADPQTEFASRRVLACKLGGYGATGFGLVFCHRAAEDPDEETMLVALINIEQEYIVGEARGAAFAPLVEWTSSTALKRGYAQENEIRVELDRTTRFFSLYLNGIYACEFTTSSPEYELGGGNGYIAVISPRDKFPASPVHIAFKELP